MKTKEELNVLKEEVEALNKKLHELTEEEIAQVTGGGDIVRVNGEDIAKLNTTEALRGKFVGAVSITKKPAD